MPTENASLLPDKHRHVRWWHGRNLEQFVTISEELLDVIDNRGDNRGKEFPSVAFAVMQDTMQENILRCSQTMGGATGDSASGVTFEDGLRLDVTRMDDSSLDEVTFVNDSGVQQWMLEGLDKQAISRDARARGRDMQTATAGGWHQVLQWQAGGVRDRGNRGRIHGDCEGVLCHR